MAFRRGYGCIWGNVFRNSFLLWCFLFLLLLNNNRLNFGWNSSLLSLFFWLNRLLCLLFRLRYLFIFNLLFRLYNWLLLFHLRLALDRLHFLLWLHIWYLCSLFLFHIFLFLLWCWLCFLLYIRLSIWLLCRYLNWCLLDYWFWSRLVLSFGWFWSLFFFFIQNFLILIRLIRFLRLIVCFLFVSLLIVIWFLSILLICFFRIFSLFFRRTPIFQCSFNN